MMRHRTSNNLRLIAAGCLFLLPVMSWAQSGTLAGDASIVPGNASNFGGLTTINVGGASGSQGLLLFDLANLAPAGSSVAWARLRFYVGSVSVPGAIDISAASAPWTESTVSGVGGPVAGAP